MHSTSKKPEEVELIATTFSSGRSNEREQLIEASPKGLIEFIEQEPDFQLTECLRYERNQLTSAERVQCTKNYQETDCTCGKPLSSHPPEVFTEAARAGPKTKEVPCHTFGEMRFMDAKKRSEVQGATAKYIRLKGRTDDGYLEKVCELLMGNNYWAIDPPQLIIEVTGSALEFTGIDERLTEKFNQALIKAAESGDAWLVTGGSNSGVMKLVGDAVAKARRLNIPLTCLGIISWGVISNRDHLAGKTPRDTGNKPVSYFVDPRSQTALNYGHNFYLLADNGVEERFGEEINFRNALMHHISERAQVFEERAEEHILRQQSHLDFVDSSSDETRLRNAARHQPSLIPRKRLLLSIPRVLLVVGGGINTLRTCKLALEGAPDRPTAIYPVVTLVGFGGAGDLIAHAHIYLQNRSKKMEQNSESAAPREFFIEMCRHPAFFGFARLTGAENPQEEQKKWDVVNEIYSLFSNRKMITVVDLRNPREMTLDKAILNAIFKAELFRNEACYRMLDLARRWDLSHVAKDIMEKFQGDMKKMEQARMDDLFSLAIVSGQCEFYQLFANYKLVSLDAYLTQHAIQELYMKLMSKMDEQEEEVRQPKKLLILRCIQLFATLLTARSKKAKQCDISLLNVGDFLADMMGCYLSNPFAIRPGSEAVKALIEQNVYVWGCRDLFVMQIILNQDKFALSLWRDGRDHIGTALMASILLHELSEHAHRNDMVSLVDPYMKQSEIWLSRAIEVLTRCNEVRPECVPELLTRVLPTWQNRTVLEMAFYGKRRRFAEQPAVLSKLGHIWHGKVASFTSSYQTYFTALFPIFIFWLYFEVDKCDRKCKHHNDHIEFLGGAGSQFQIRPLASTSLHSQVKKTVILRPSLLCRCCCDNLPHDRLSLPRALFHLYTSPMVKFFFHTIALLAFLLLFSSFILNTSLHPDGATTSEIVLLIWSMCLLCDGLYESFGLDLTVFLEENSSDQRAFFDETWRRLLHGCYNAILFDIISETILITSFILRHTVTVEYFVYPQTLYAVACLFFWIKSFRIFYLSESIGILVVTLGKILPILLQFLLLYIMLIASFAPPLFALSNPQFTKSAKNEEDPDFFSFFLDVIYKRWWNLVGVAIDITRSRIEETCPISYASRIAKPTFSEVPDLLAENATASSWINEIRPSGTMDNPGIQRCESGGSILGRNFVAAILFVSYLWLTNITWLNMLIASLNRSVEATRASAIELWSFNYYIAVRTWYHRCVTPAPFSFFELMYRFAAYIWNQGKNRETPMRKYAKEIDNLRWDELERSAVDKMLDEAEEKTKR